MEHDWILLISSILVLGAFAGFLAGLLGIGGGIVLVPGLYYLFQILGYEPDLLMHLSVGTSLAIIIPTGLSSARAHWKKGGVDLGLVKTIGGGIVAGVVVGSFIAAYLSGEDLKVIFAFALLVFAGLMQIDPKKFSLAESMPAQPLPSIVGCFIGTLSTLMGIGGATLNVPFMSLHGVPIHKAIGTASSLGPLIAVPGALGFVLIGWGMTGLPPYSIGYVNLIAFALITPVSVLIAPIGAKTAHALPVDWMRRIFSVFMVLVSAKMLYSAFVG